MPDFAVTIVASALGAMAGWVAHATAHEEQLKRMYRWGRVDATRDIMRKIEEKLRGHQVD